MKISLIFLIIYSLCALDAFSQGYNNIFVSYSPLLYLNKANVENDGRGFDPISTRNTFGQHIGLEFERTTKQGILLNGGLFYGYQTHDILIEADFTGYDSRAINNLDGAHFTRRIFVRNPYLFPRILVGYKKNLGRSYALSAKAGVGLKLFSAGKETDNFYVMRYRTDDSITLVDVVFGREWASIDNRSGEALRGRVRTIELFLGLQRKLDKMKWIKSVDIGLEYSRAWPNAEGIDKVEIITNNIKGAPFSNISEDNYYNKYRSIGLRVAFGF